MKGKICVTILLAKILQVYVSSSKDLLLAKSLEDVDGDGANWFWLGFIDEFNFITGLGAFLAQATTKLCKFLWFWMMAQFIEDSIRFCLEGGRFDVSAGLGGETFEFF